MKVKYVSFDVFDTLVRRIIPVNDIYNLMEITLKEKYNIEIKDFSKKRLLAEEETKNRFGNNYNIDQIYSMFLDKKLSQKEIDTIISLEKEYEINCTIPNKMGLDLYHKYKNKYKIICISDMFLDKKTITKILNNNGYNIDKIYVSCEENKSKREKNLYKKVLQDLKIMPNEIIHIGDAIRSDYINPKLLGIKSKLVKNELENNSYYDFGFNLFGPLLYEFCKWIKTNISKDKQLLFVSREGEFIKKCFNILYPNIHTKMIYLSRKSVIAGTSSEILETHSLLELVKMISIKRNETINELFDRLGLNLKDKLSEFNIKLNDRIDDRLDVFYRKYKNEIINDLKNNYFENYLNQELKEENILVDIGWKGSMQTLLTNYTNKKIYGLYLGIMDNNNKKGYLFNTNNDICQNVLNYSGLLELIMMPEYGSVIGYQENDKSIKPIFDTSEFSDYSLKIINEIQLGIIVFIKKMKLLDNKLHFNKENIIKQLNNFGSNPRIKDIKYFENLDFYDNGKIYHLIEPIKINKLKENFINTKWKTAFLKKIFKIKLPYNKIIILLRRNNDK